MPCARRNCLGALMDFGTSPGNSVTCCTKRSFHTTFNPISIVRFGLDLVPLLERQFVRRGRSDCLSPEISSGRSPRPDGASYKPYRLVSKDAGGYFGVDIGAIQYYAKTFDDIEHLRAEIRDFDAHDLRLRQPAVLSKLYKAVNRNGGVTYVHCTAGLGRAPAVALAYMFWVQGYKLNEAHKLLQSKRPSFPKVDAIKSATADILTGVTKKLVTLTWDGKNCSTVEISGLDIGWGQRIPLKFDEEQGLWSLTRELPEGHYEYKYIIDDEWTINKYELFTSPNKDGHVNNYVKVLEDPSSASAALRKRLFGDDPVLTTEEKQIIRQFLEAYPDDE
ncbi:hypothetical protein UlMin_026070 [Ulmus minor]